MKTNFTRIVSAAVTVFALLLTAQACTESKGKGNAIPKHSEPIPVKVIDLKTSETTIETVTSGRLTTDDETTLSFKTGGVVNAVYVDDGDKVRKGQLLATLDLTEINSLLAQAQSGVEKAERDLARVKNLYSDSVATLEQLQNAETAVEMAKQQYNAVHFNKSYSQIKALSDGYVLKRFVNPGQVVGVGDPVVQTNGAGAAKWMVRSGVSDRQWSSIALQDEAIITVDAFPGEKFKGRVTRRYETADPSTGSFTIEISVDGGRNFASGMFASAKIVSSRVATAWQVPFEAVLDADGNEGFVFVTNDKLKATKTKVVIDSFDGSSIKIRSGLENSKMLIVSGSAYLTDNSPIQIIP